MILSTATYNSIDRTSLIRIWNQKLPKCHIIMYYPSTATGIIDDKTVERCVNIAKFNGYGSIFVTNIHKDVLNLFDTTVEEIIVAWGNKVSKDDNEKMINKLRERNLRIKCFKRNKNGTPSLPTRLSYSTVINNY